MASNGKNSGGGMAARIFAGDKVMWVVIVILLVYSLFVVYSTTAYDMGVSAGQELIRQLLYICFGMTGFYVAQSLSIRTYKRIAVPFLLLSLLLTLLMIFAHSGSGELPYRKP